MIQVVILTLTAWPFLEAEFTKKLVKTPKPVLFETGYGPSICFSHIGTFGMVGNFEPAAFSLIAPNSNQNDLCF